ncbi:MAG: penicillin-binding transpeptidase domain-containing protein, partial [Patescibacteria group bacterium]
MVVLGLRLFNLQVLSYDDYKAAADGEHQLFRKIHPERGSIFLRERYADAGANKYLMDVHGERLFPAVTNREYMLVYAVPKSVDEPEKVAQQLLPLFDTTPETIIENKTENETESEADKKTEEEGSESPNPIEERRQWLIAKLSKKNDSYEVIKRKVPAAQWDAIKKLRIGGIGATPESYRFYPEKGLGGQLFGFVGYSGDIYKGLYGLEGYFDDILKGKEGSLAFESDALGALIPIGEKRVVDAVNGSHLVLTIDRTIQLMACDRLSKWVTKHGADGGSVVIMNPKTGALLAMCSVPDIDPERYFESDVKNYPNPAIFTPYEPGSIFKPFTVAIGLDMEKITPTTTYEDTGEVKIGSFTIKNSDTLADKISFGNT